MPITRRELEEQGFDCGVTEFHGSPGNFSALDNSHGTSSDCLRLAQELGLDRRDDAEPVFTEKVKAIVKRDEDGEDDEPGAMREEIDILGNRTTYC